MRARWGSLTATPFLPLTIGLASTVEELVRLAAGQRERQDPAARGRRRASRVDVTSCYHGEFLDISLDPWRRGGLRKEK